MNKFKFLMVITLLFAFKPAIALDINYGSVLSVKSPDVLIEYYGIENKAKFLCNITTYNCTSTKKTTLATTNPAIISKTLKKEMKDRGADHLTFSPSRNLFAYYISNKVNTNTRIFGIKNIKTKKDYMMAGTATYWDLVDEQSKVFEFSPDNKNLIYMDDKDNTMSMYIVDTSKLSGENFSGTKLNTDSYNIANFIYYNSQTIFYIGNEKENPYKWSLHEFNLKTGKDTLIENYVSYTTSLKKVGTSIIFNRLQESGYGPMVYNVASKKIRQFKIPKVNSKIDLSREEVVKMDDMYGVLMTPNINNDLNKKYKLVVWLHGGPYRQTSYGYHPYHSYGIYDSILKLFQKNDVLVLKLDYRGSFGFGRDYSESIKKEVGRGDVDDVITAVKYMKNRYNIDEVYLSGNSYGGYLSLKSLVERPKNFTGVFSINGVTDWESLLIKLRTSIFNVHFGGLPNDTTQELYDQANIINKIKNIKNQKVAIIQGEADRTIPLWQAKTFYDKLKENNIKNITYVTYPGEDHVFAKKKTITDLCVQMFNFVGVTPDKNCTE